LRQLRAGGPYMFELIDDPPTAAARRKPALKTLSLVLAL
jgi:hypothetical protein